MFDDSLMTKLHPNKHLNTLLSIQVGNVKFF